MHEMSNTFSYTDNIGHHSYFARGKYLNHTVMDPFIKPVTIISPRGIVLTLSVCLYVCVCVYVCMYVFMSVSVCPANILVFYFSAIRYIDLKFMQATYRVVLNSLKM